STGPARSRWARPCRPATGRRCCAPPGRSCACRSGVASCSGSTSPRSRPGRRRGPRMTSTSSQSGAGGGARSSPDADSYVAWDGLSADAYDSASPGPPVYGFQEPRLCWQPPGAVSSAGEEAIALAARAGLVLDPWQCWVLDRSLAERRDGKWAAWEVALICSRQNGKTAILEARELAGLFLFGEELIVHTAHQFKTSSESFRRIQKWLRN